MILSNVLNKLIFSILTRNGEGDPSRIKLVKPITFDFRILEKEQIVGTVHWARGIITTEGPRLTPTL